MKKAFITGVTGQDGAYLADYLLEIGYEVYGGFRRTSTTNFWRLDYLSLQQKEHFHLVEYNLLDLGNTIRILNQIKPDEIYNLAAQSFVGVSFEQPVYTSMTTGLGATNLLEAIRTVDSQIKYYQASTSEMFGKIQEEKQNESTSFYPRSPYGVAKLYAHWMTINYREAYDIFGTNGILFNHESPLRGIEFVTRKITDAVSKITLGKLDLMKLGNINASRDWGYAKDYVKGMHAMLQADSPDDFVLATGVTSTIREFVVLAFAAVDIEIRWEGEGLNEKGLDGSSGKVLVEIDETFFRPSEVEVLLGDYSKAKQELGWSPETDLNSLVSIMMKADLERNER